MEVKERKDRVDDAVAATKAAVADGIVPGGGVTLLDLSRTMAMTPSKATDTIDAGRLILKRALAEPFKVLMQNAGISAEEKMSVVVTSNKPGYGFDVNDPDKFVDLKAKGIIDPASVTREAILNAVSVGGTGMTMGALIAEIAEEKTLTMQPPQ